MRADNVMKKNLRDTLLRIGLPSFMTLAGVTLLLVLLLTRLDSLVPGWSAAELATRASAINHHALLANPVDGPYKVLVYLLLKIGSHSVKAVRLVSAGFGLLTIVSFFYIVRCWHSPRTAWLASLLFATSTWFLRTSRMGTPDVLLFGLLMLMALCLWLQRTHQRPWVLFLVTLACSLSLYIPGLIWFLAITAYWQRKIIRRSLRTVPRSVTSIAILIALLLLLPLGWGIGHHWHLIFSVLGLPMHVPGAVATLKHLADVPLNLFVRGPLQPGIWVGRSAVLDVFESALFLFGVYSYWQHRRLARFASLVSVFVATTMLTALGGPVTLSLLVPFVYLVMATGLTFLLGEWLSVFPRNPIARGLGLTIVVVAVLISCGYQLNRYFVAWPHMPATKAAYALHVPSA
jgi:hypothetical protein